MENEDPHPASVTNIISCHTAFLFVVILGTNLAKGYGQTDVGKCCSTCDCEGYIPSLEGLGPRKAVVNQAMLVGVIRVIGASHPVLPQ